MIIKIRNKTKYSLPINLINGNLFSLEPGVTEKEEDELNSDELYAYKQLGFIVVKCNE